LYSLESKSSAASFSASRHLLVSVRVSRYDPIISALMLNRSSVYLTCVLHYNPIKRTIEGIANIIARMVRNKTTINVFLAIIPSTYALSDDSVLLISSPKSFIRKCKNRASVVENFSPSCGILLDSEETSSVKLLTWCFNSSTSESIAWRERSSLMGFWIAFHMLLISSSSLYRRCCVIVAVLRERTIPLVKKRWVNNIAIIASTTGIS